MTPPATIPPACLGILQNIVLFNPGSLAPADRGYVIIVAMCTGPNYGLEVRNVWGVRVLEHSLRCLSTWLQEQPASVFHIYCGINSTYLDERTCLSRLL